MLRVLFSLLFLVGTSLSAQFLHYEPGTWQEMAMMSYDSFNFRDLDLGNRFYPRNNDIVPTFTTRNPMAGEKGPKSIITGGMKGFNWKYFTADNSEYYINKNYSGRIYAHPAMFIQYVKGKSVFGFNPILNLQAGPPAQWGRGFINNTRGLEMRGNLEKRLAFYMRMTENQTWFPQYAIDYMDSFGVLPGYGFWKKFSSGSKGFTGGTDYSGTTGYVDAGLINNSEDSNYLVMSFGHGGFQSGFGYRSLLLSNFSTPFAFLKLNSRIGRFRYQNLYAQLNGFTPLVGNTLLPKKYLTMHRASILLGNRNRFEFGVSETIIHSRADGLGNFDIDYLNPIIFYRTIESNLGSRDNALMAIDARWSSHHLSFYGQFLLDEFKLKYMKSGGWWANKWGAQVGATQSFTRREIGTFFFQQEFNYVRPYTYTHTFDLNSYTHYNQPLAHPLESNFWEVLGRLYIQPAFATKLRFMVTGFYAKKGFDNWTGGIDYGSNPRRDNDLRWRDFDIKMLQGEQATIINFKTEISYMIWHNLNIDLGVQYRSQSGFRPSDGLWINGGLRLNFEPSSQLY